MDRSEINRVLIIALVCGYFVYTDGAATGRKSKIGNGNRKKFGMAAWIEKDGEHVCGASLIDRRWVLTAASCVADRMMKRYRVYLGDYNTNTRQDGEQRIQTDNIRIHPEFMGDDNDANDIALLHLERPANEKRTYIEVLERLSRRQLDEQVEESDKKCFLPSFKDLPKNGFGWYSVMNDFITYWSFTISGGSNIMEVLDVRIRDNNVCGHIDGYDQKRHICYGSVKGTSGSCEGDKGSLIVCDIMKIKTQLALHSNGAFQDGCLRGFGIRISFFRKWIRKTMEEGNAVDGRYSDWTPWEVCPVTCGGGTQSRSRTCTNPAPKNGGNDCIGEASETQTCNTEACPIDGGYSDWTPWEVCSVTCGGGTQSRSRTCTNPALKNGGNDCIGEASETQTCNTEACPNCGPWPVLNGMEVVPSESSTHTLEGAIVKYICSYSKSNCIFKILYGDSTATCQSNGWSLPSGQCMTMTEAGLLPDGVTPLDPNNYNGCQSTYNTTACSSGGIANGLRFNGQTGTCYCDTVCCIAGDCCYDTNCPP